MAKDPALQTGATCPKWDSNPGRPILTVLVVGANHCATRPPHPSENHKKLSVQWMANTSERKLHHGYAVKPKLYFFYIKNNFMFHFKVQKLKMVHNFCWFFKIEKCILALICKTKWVGRLWKMYCWMLGLSCKRRRGWGGENNPLISI